MHTIRCTIEGATALLMQNPASMLQAKPPGGRKEIPKPEEEAASKAYWSDDKSTLVLHSEHVMGTILNAAKPYRMEGARRASVVPVLAGSLEVMPDKIPLNTTQYEVDVRPVVVEQKRVMRARPKVWPWAATMTIYADDRELSRAFCERTLREILERAGRLVGLLDFRPQHKGRHGKFNVTLWELE